VYDTVSRNRLKLSRSRDKIRHRKSWHFQQLPWQYKQTVAHINVLWFVNVGWNQSNSAEYYMSRDTAVLDTILMLIFGNKGIGLSAATQVQCSSSCCWVHYRRVTEGVTRSLSPSVPDYIARWYWHITLTVASSQLAGQKLQCTSSCC